MKRHMAVLSAALLLWVACSDNNRSVPSAPVGLRADNVNLTLSSGSTTLKVGQTLQLSIIHTHNGLAYTGNAVWQSSAPAVATVDATGLVTAVAPGTASITATNTSGEQDDGSVMITVLPNVLRVIGLTWIAGFDFPGQTGPQPCTGNPSVCVISGGTIAGAPPNSPVSLWNASEPLNAFTFGGSMGSPCGMIADANGNVTIPTAASGCSLNNGNLIGFAAAFFMDAVYVCPNDWLQFYNAAPGYAQVIAFAASLSTPGVAAANNCAGPFTVQ